MQFVVERRNVTEAVDDVLAKVPLMSASQLTREHDFYARALRKIDAVIQRANWDTQVEAADETLADYEVPEKIEDDRAKQQVRAPSSGSMRR